ncbi:MAG: prepilin-type N-terminal cleavage/methylation domain-containing protein [Cellulosilyticum sp.]|nr:prepilin-type N-terminal cleavage/methylation domain-containing protein [Cellulosilyticum sp.]
MGYSNNEGMKLMSKIRDNEKGFTIIELIIVVAIMGIIGALLVPSYGTISAKARLTTDISTIKTLKRTVDSYRAEKGRNPSSETFDDLIKELKKAGYLDSQVSLQTDGNIITQYTEGMIKLDTQALDKNVYEKAYNQLDSTTQTDWCNGVPKGTKSRAEDSTT